MSAAGDAQPQVVAAETDPLWFLGTLARIKLDGAQTGGRLGVSEGLFPHGAAPPLHSHPRTRGSTCSRARSQPGWLTRQPQRTPVILPAGSPSVRTTATSAPWFTPPAEHRTPSRAESATARMLIISTPAGIEEYVRALREPALSPWLQPPPDGPRVPAERMKAVEQQLNLIRHGPPPPPV